MTQRPRRNALASHSTRTLLPLVALLGGWLFLSAQACKSPESKPSPAPSTNNTAGANDATSTNNTTGHTSAQQTGGAAGEAKPGTLLPKTAGPAGPAVFLLNGAKGYLEPCGCTADVKLGGIDRIGGYLARARKLYPKSVLLDGGNLFFEEPHLDKIQIPQARAKVDVIVAAHKKYGTQITVPGPLDFALGATFYQDAIKRAGIEPIAVNASIAGKQLNGTRLFDLGGVKLGVIGAVDPALYEKVKDVKATPATPAIQAAVKALKAKGADTILLLHQGSLATTKTLLTTIPALDFALVGHKPRETDQVDSVGDAHTMEVYDQGRYLGVLKLMHADQKGRWRNARTGSKAELERNKRLIARTEETINQLPPAPQGKEPPLLKKLREKLARLKREQQEIKNAKLDLPADRRVFLFNSVPMEPGYHLDDALSGALADYNKKLPTILGTLDVKIPEPKPGEAFYVGTAQCATCHAAAAKFWKGTLHSHAFATLEKKGKHVDQDCVSCHVVGYNKPGGSALGKYTSPMTLHGKKQEKQLHNVGCESCHGPGSKHIEGILSGGKPAHISRAVPATQCMQCHVKEHSPRFNYDVYVKQITGKGHGGR